MVVGLHFISTRRYDLGLERRLKTVVSRIKWGIGGFVYGVVEEGCGGRGGGVDEQSLIDGELTHGWGYAGEQEDGRMKRVFI